MPDLFNEPTDGEIVDEILADFGPLSTRELWEEFAARRPERIVEIARQHGPQFVRKLAERTDPSTGLPKAAVLPGPDGTSVVVQEQLFQPDHYTQVIYLGARRLKDQRDRLDEWAARCFERYAIAVDVEAIIDKAWADADAQVALDDESEAA